MPLLQNKNLSKTDGCHGDVACLSSFLSAQKAYTKRDFHFAGSFELSEVRIMTPSTMILPL
jgi:hypothetical protein